MSPPTNSVPPLPGRLLKGPVLHRPTSPKSSWAVLARLARTHTTHAVLPWLPVAESTPAYTVNRLCGSGLQAIWSAAMQMQWSGANFTLAGGNESMSRMPFYDFTALAGFTLGDRSLVDGTVAMLTDPFSNMHMGVTAENVARKYGVSRQEQDEFALESQRRAASAAA